MSHWPKDNQSSLIEFYGMPGHAVEAQLVPVTPPFRMTYEGKPIEHIMFHKKCAAALLAALTEIWEHYGKDQSKLDALGVSHYDGAYNPRFIRGSNSKWSNHAYGAALDINAKDNGFNTGHGTMPKPVVDAFKRQGARWGGDYHGRTDPMHFEFCDNGEPEAVVAQPKPADVVKPPPATPLPASATNITSGAAKLAAVSPFATLYWRDRGHAPAGYIKGMAVAFAVLYERLKWNDPTVVAMAVANTGDDEKDALSWYNSNFNALGMKNDVFGADTFRHLFVLLTGLGMRESSGRFCCGRDRSTNNITADTAEAGLFQMSYNATSAHPLMRPLMDSYKSATVDGYLETFREDVHCSADDFANYGIGTPGGNFQELCKIKPMFAVAEAALGLRVIRRHWGPINRKEVEISVVVDKLYQQIQQLVDENKTTGVTV